ncbi:MAG: PKD domain-containing protein [Candidatus Pacearchaeota archaeon]
MKKNLPIKFATFIFLLVLLLILADINVNAEYSKGTPTLVVNDVGPNQPLSGYLNISLVNESGGNEISAELDGKTASFSLLEFMKRAKSLGISFNCSYEGKPSECELQYKDASSSDTFQGNAGDNYAGLVISGKSGVEITDLSFVITGTTGNEECTTEAPFIIDLFNDGSPDYYYLSAGSDICGEKYNENYTAKETANIGTSFICDTVKLEYKSARVKIGGDIALVEGGNESVLLFFKIARGGKEASCNTTYYDKPSCDVDFNVYPGEYEICVRAATADAYSISAGSKEEGKQHFALFAAEYKNQPFAEEIQFNSTLYAAQTGKNLVSELNSYLRAKYNQNCSAKCIIPLYINSTVAFSFANLRFKYKFGGVEYTISSFSTLQREFPLITTAGHVAIPLAAFNITAPSTYGNYSLRVVYKGTEIAKKSFKVERVPVVVGIYPMNITVGEPTEFRVIAYSPRGLNITSYAIDFGDGSTASSSNGIFSHTYTNSGAFNVKIEVTDSAGFKGTGYFTLNVGISASALNSSINNAINAINNFESSLALAFYANWLKNVTNTASLKAQLNNLSSRLLQAGNNITLLQQIKQEYSNLKPSIPSSLDAFLSFPQISYIVDWNKVDMSSASSVAGTCAFSQDECKKSIALWSFNNVQLKLGGEKKKLKYLSGEAILTILDISISTKTSQAQSGKLILLLDPSKSYANANYNASGSALAFPLSLANIKVAYFGDLDIYSVTLFAVPSDLTALEPVTEKITGPVTEAKKKSKTPLILLLIFTILLLVGGIIFIWHKKLLELGQKIIKARKAAKEKALFPSRADYYNIMTFISNSLESGMTEDTIRKKLLSAGWKEAQITYALKEVKAMKAREKAKEKEKPK